MAHKSLKVRFLDGFLDGQKWTMRVWQTFPKDPKSGIKPADVLILEPVLPFNECRGVYKLYDRGADKRTYRFEYHYEQTWSEALEQLSADERFTRLRAGVLCDPSAVLGLGASAYH